MEVVDLVSIGYAADVENRSPGEMRQYIGVFHDLVNEIPQMQDERQPILGRGALIFPNHAAIGILCAFIHALARNESKTHRSHILEFRRGNSSACTAAIAITI